MISSDTAKSVICVNWLRCGCDLNVLINGKLSVTFASL